MAIANSPTRNLDIEIVKEMDYLPQSYTPIASSKLTGLFFLVVTFPYFLKLTCRCVNKRERERDDER